MLFLFLGFEPLTCNMKLVASINFTIKCARTIGINCESLLQYVPQIVIFLNALILSLLYRYCFVNSFIQEGLVYAVEFSHRSGRDLLNVAKKRTNIIPIIEDARHPHKYRMLVGE